MAQKTKKEFLYWHQENFFPIQIGYTRDIRVAEGFAKTLGIESDNLKSKKGMAHTVRIETDEQLYLIIVLNPHIEKHSKIDNSVANLALLVHEITHVMQYVKEYTGEDDMGKETEAYFVQNLFQFMATLINNQED